VKRRGGKKERNREKEEKLATALEEGRSFGLRQQMLEMHLRQQLTRLCRRPLTQKMF
jgi:hypothetical protein